MRTLPEVIPLDLLPRLMQKLAIVGTASLVFLAGCGGATVNNNPPPTPIPSPQLTVSPSSATVHVGASQQFTATVTPSGANHGVTWSVSGTGCMGASCGTIDTAGKYTAPATVPTSNTVTITARSAVDATNAGTATVTMYTGRPTPGWSSPWQWLPTHPASSGSLHT